MLRLAAVLRPLRDAGTVRRISTTLAVPQRLAGTPLPWFIDPADVAPKRPSARTQPRHALPLAPLPSVIPQESPIGRLHATLATSPHLEPGTLVVREPISSASGPPTQQPAKGRRRRRGGGDPGEGIPDPGSGIWNWIVVAQVNYLCKVTRHNTHEVPLSLKVKEGTENRGAIESVMRVVRKTVRGMYTGWQSTHPARCSF